MSLAVADPSSGGSVPAPDVEQCECPWGYSGTSCEVGAECTLVSLFCQIKLAFCIQYHLFWALLVLCANLFSALTDASSLSSTVFLGFIELEASCLEETVCSVSVTIMPQSVTSMESVW